MKAPPNPQLARLGRLFFAAALFAFGIQHLVLGQFVTRLVLPSSPWGALPKEGSYLVGLLLVAVGTCVLLQVKRLAVTWGFSAACLATFVLQHVPAASAGIAWGGEWTSAGKVLAFCALGLAVSDPNRFSEDERSKERPSGIQPGTGLTVDWLARGVFSAYLALAGIQHFIWAPFVDTLVPSWMPFPRFWTYFTAVALLAGAAGLLLSRTRRAAGVLTGGMILLWVFLVHLPRVFSMRNANETTALFEALAFAGLAWLLAGRRAVNSRVST